LNTLINLPINGKNKHLKLKNFEIYNYILTKFIIVCKL
jgi:hypothetical protein